MIVLQGCSLQSSLSHSLAGIYALEVTGVFLVLETALGSCGRHKGRRFSIIYHGCILLPSLCLRA